MSTDNQTPNAPKASEALLAAAERQHAAAVGRGDHELAAILASTAAQIACDLAEAAFSPTAETDMAAAYAAESERWAGLAAEASDAAGNTEATEAAAASADRASEAAWQHANGEGLVSER